MRWEDREESNNVDDRRNQGSSFSSKRGVPSMGTLLFLWPMVKPLLKTKAGMLIVGVGAVLYFSGFNPLSSTASNSTSVNKAHDDKQAKFISTILHDTEEVWKEIYKKEGGVYKEPEMVLYRKGTTSGCGMASAEMGPFYCPADQKVYLDLSFFDELAKRHNAEGDFAQAYVLAHEIGHHIQNMEGTLHKVQRLKQQVRGEAQANQLQVRVELQADCYAGVWANHAHKRFNILEKGDIQEALRAASAIGDDTLQKQAQGYVVTDKFTHGSSKQRVAWFTKGIQTGDIKSCNTGL